MQGPTGFSRLQTRRKRGHWSRIEKAAKDFSAPTSGRFFTGGDIDLESPGCVKRSVYFPESKTAPGKDTKTPPFCVADLKDPVHDGQGRLVSLGKDASRIGIIDSASAFADLIDEHADASKDIERLETCHGDGNAILAREEISRRRCRSQW